jgi:S-adenosylmethionine decarboxylase proenzyme
MHGLHLTADLTGCDPALPAMTDPAVLRVACLGAVEAVGLRAVGELFHRFAPRPDTGHAPGVTGVVLLAESHAAVHTWPELGAVTLDVYVCNLGRDHSAQAEALLAQLQALFAPGQALLNRLVRGQGAEPRA